MWNLNPSPSTALEGNTASLFPTLVAGEDTLGKQRNVNVSATGNLLVDISSSATITVIPLTGSTPTQTSVSYSTASQTLKASNSSRIGITIVNDATRNLFIRLDPSAATSANFMYRLYPGSTLVLPDYGIKCYTGEIRGIWASGGSGSARITEYV